MSDRWTFTSESVTEGHPDKMADQISDAVLDAILGEDPKGRVACETLLTTGLVVVAGEITTEAYVDIPKIVRDTVCGIGYDRESYGFDGNTCGVITSIDEQSPNIAQGVDTAHEIRSGISGEDILNAQGAGDQGMMFGYACDETEDLMPLPIWLAHRLAQRLAQVRKADVVNYLRPDGKTQVTFEYENGRATRLKTVLVSTQHAPGVDLETLLKPDLRDHVITPIVPAEFAGDRYDILANPTGTFELGGPHADTGLTGRKIIVDTYGGAARHGGGAFSGKDPSKVDRSAAYAARWVAKHVVASGTYGYQGSRSPSGDFDLSSQSLGGRVSVTLAKGLSLGLGYTESDSHYGNLAHVRSHFVDGGVNFSRALSVSRKKWIRAPFSTNKAPNICSAAETCW